MTTTTTSNGIKEINSFSLISNLSIVKNKIHEKINFKSNLIPSDRYINCRAVNCMRYWNTTDLQFAKEMPTQTRPHQGKYGGRGLKRNNDIIFYSKF